MVKMMSEIGTSMIDLIHAMMIFCGGPFFVCFLLLSFLNQLVRKAACLTFSKKLNGDVDAKQTFTSLAHAKLSYMAKWNWGATLRNVNYLAIAGWVVKFGSTLTYMGLRWMIDLMLGADLSCGASSGIFLLVGAIMFLLPPVPGLAVYLCAGVLLTPVCEDSMGGFWGAAIYSSFFAYSIKMIAHVMQQKLIGECCGAKSVGVRAAVAINSELMRTIRYILEQRGISIAKVCIMCGGPDWPTSVLCGILGLNVFQMLLGLSPVFLLTVPTSLAGAFQLKTSEGQMWESAATIMLMVASLTQLVAAVAMMYLIQQTKTHRRDKIQDFPTDEDVARKDKEDEENVKAFAHVTSFGVMSRPATALLLSATASSYVSFYMLYTPRDSNREGPVPGSLPRLSPPTSPVQVLPRVLPAVRPRLLARQGHVHEPDRQRDLARGDLRSVHRGLARVDGARALPLRMPRTLPLAEVGRAQRAGVHRGRRRRRRGRRGGDGQPAAERERQRRGPAEDVHVGEDEASARAAAADAGGGGVGLVPRDVDFLCVMFT